MKIGEYFRVSRKLGITWRMEVMLLALLVMAAAFEGIGIGMLLPIIGFVESAGDISALAAESELWRRMIDVFQFVGLPITLGSLIAVSFGSILLRQAVSYARQIYYLRLREKLIFDACNQGFLRFLEADAAYHDREASGSVVNSLTTELRMAVDAIMSPIQIVSFCVMMVFYICLLMVLTGPVTVAVMVVFGLAIVALKRLLSKTLKTGEQLAEANKDMSAFVVQRLSSPRLVRLSGTEEAELTDLRRLTERQRDSTVHMKTYLARVDILLEPLSIGIGFAMLYLGVKYFAIGIEEIGIFAVVAMMRLLPTVQAVLRSSQTFLAFVGSLTAFERRIDEMLAARENRGGDLQFEGLHDAIRFADVGFHYETVENVPALHALNLTMPAGKMTALVGPSGAGKSTLVDLLPRLRDPSTGTVYFDNEPLRNFSVHSLRAGISYVSQLPVIFNVTVAQHIRYGKPNATDEEIQKAAELAGAADFISRLPGGFDALLGENGVRLSGGQRQRLDFARALVRQAPILIFDEPTSNLDAEAEERFRDVLERIRKETKATIVVVAHRLSTVATADQILVLKGGQVTEAGTHSELLTGGGWYAGAYAQQILATGKEKDGLQTAVG